MPPSSGYLCGMHLGVWEGGEVGGETEYRIVKGLRGWRVRKNSPEPKEMWAKD